MDKLLLVSLSSGQLNQLKQNKSGLQMFIAKVRFRLKGTDKVSNYCLSHKFQVSSETDDDKKSFMEFPGFQLLLRPVLMKPWMCNINSHVRHSATVFVPSTNSILFVSDNVID